MSSPFDWMMDYRLDTLVKFLKQKSLTGFFLNAEYMNRNSGNHRVVKDCDSGVISMHSFPVEKTIDEFYPRFIEIMNNRFKRLIRIFDNSHSITFLSNRKDINEIKNFLVKFNELYINKQITYINVTHSPNLKEYIVKKEHVTSNILIVQVLFNDVHAKGNTRDNPDFWLGNEFYWNKLCSEISLSNAHTLLASKEDIELH